LRGGAGEGTTCRTHEHSMSNHIKEKEQKTRTGSPTEPGTQSNG
jgi:hypothetical protein